MENLLAFELVRKKRSKEKQGNYYGKDKGVSEYNFGILYFFRPEINLHSLPFSFFLLPRLLFFFRGRHAP